MPALRVNSRLTLEALCPTTTKSGFRTDWSAHFYLSLLCDWIQWSLTNHFRAILHKWCLAQSSSCDCGQRQTMNHIVDTCPITKFEGGLDLLHEADDDGHLSGIYSDCTHTHTHTRLTALCPGLPGWAGTRKVKPIWILLEQEIVSGSGISWACLHLAPDR